MESRKIKIETGPPQLLVAIVEKLIPYHHREYVLGDLCDRYVSPLHFIRDAAEWVCFLVPSQVRRSFKIGLLVAEASALAVSFSGVTVSFKLGFLFGVMLAALVSRDAYIHPASGTPQNAVVDVLVAITAAVLVQAFLGLAAPHLALPLEVLIRPAALSLLTVSAVRMMFREAPGWRRVTRPSYKRTMRINLLWMIAATVIVLTNAAAVPTFMQHQNFFFVVLPITVFSFGFRLRKNALDGTVRMGGIPSLLQDPLRSEITRKRRNLWVGPEGNSSRFPWHTAVELLAFILFALPLGIVLVSWLTGHTPASRVNWLLAGSNAAVSLALSVLWFYVRKENERTAGALQEEIDALDASEK